MAAANVFNITGAKKSHKDQWVLAFVSKWNIARAEASLIWARNTANDIAAYGNWSSEASAAKREAVNDQIERMEDAQAQLSVLQPETTMGAHALVNAVIDILQHRQIDSEAILASGPGLEILINVSHALGARDVPLKA